MDDELAPLFVLSGAPGAGKTTLLPELVRLGRAAGGLVVADIDEILEDGALLGVPIATQDAAADWAAYDRLWHRILTLPRRAGHAALVLGPWTPSDPGAGGDASGWAVLDCADEVRISRLRARGWPSDQIGHALADAAAYRAAIPTAFVTDTATPAELAEAVVAWIASTRQGLRRRGHRHPPRPDPRRDLRWRRHDPRRNAW